MGVLENLINSVGELQEQMQKLLDETAQLSMKMATLQIEMEKLENKHESKTNQ